MIFANRNATCLVNPRACRETEIDVSPLPKPQRRRVAVIGGGPAGLAAASTAAQRGHTVTLFEGSNQLGGQFNLAKQIPGKEEFGHSIDYFKRQLELHNVTVRLNCKATTELVTPALFDHVIVATGVSARRPKIPGIDHKSVVMYNDVLTGAKVGRRVVIMGAGGIGHDVAEFLTHPTLPAGTSEATEFLKDWGIDQSLQSRGGLLPKPEPMSRSEREVVLLQRSKGKMGQGLRKVQQLQLLSCVYVVRWIDS